jgi:hypothetical protein
MLGLTGAAAGTLAWMATPLGPFIKGGILLSVLTAGTLIFGLEPEDHMLLKKLKKRFTKQHRVG